MLSGWFHSISFSDEHNKESHIQKAELIYTYINDLKEKIILFEEKYDVKTDKNLEQEIHELGGMLRILKSIQVGDIDEKTSKEAMVLIIDKLKKSKNNITSILKKKKEGFEKRLENKKKVFSRLWEKVSTQLDDLIKQIFKKMKERGFGKDGIWERERQLITSLNTLFKENIKLQRFWDSNFSSEKEMKIKFLRILKKIKREMMVLKKTWLN